MLIHPTMSMALAQARLDDLVREVRPRVDGRRHTHLRRRERTNPTSRTGLARLPGHAVRRVFRRRLAEPAG
jgi:hypothetical protein